MLLGFCVKWEELRAADNVLGTPYCFSEEQSSENDVILDNWNIFNKKYLSAFEVLAES